jgi:hypothetical protein
MQIPDNHAYEKNYVKNDNYLLSMMTLRNTSQMLCGARIRLYCEVSKSRMTPV